MTRYLNRALLENETPGAADLIPDQNRHTDRLFAYHEATKHSYVSVRSSAHFLDWRNQPDPFRVYHGVPTIPLGSPQPLPEVGTFATISSLAQPRTMTPPITLQLLNALLHHSMAISAWKQVPETNFRYSLRVNPSSGNLHPTETHVVVGASPDFPLPRDIGAKASGSANSELEEGLYHYRVLDHALERRSRGPWAAKLADVCSIEWLAGAPLIVLLTSILWREAWKYRDRAYRYCCHDLGHAAMSLLCAARALGLGGVWLSHFPDLELACALGLESSDEAPMAVLVFGVEPRSAGTPPTNKTHDSFVEPPGGVANELSDEEVPYYLLLGMHRSTLLPPSEPLPAPPALSPSRASPDSLSLAETPSRDLPLGMIARRRRSALDFDPETQPMEAADLGVILRHATADFRADFRGNLFGGKGSDLVQLYLYVHRVRGILSGVYRYHAAEPAAAGLEPMHLGDVQRAAAYLSLEQPLAGHACVAFSLVADLEAAARAFGNRGYRYAHFEAGAIGQRLYLGAEATGWNSTGIGAFYDDDVHRFLNLEPSAGQVIYHFAVGRAVPDPRLTVPEN